MDEEDVIVVGAGVAGLTAGLFTARAGLSTLTINCGSSILNRNAHLENYPGFPDGIDPRLLLTMMEDQAKGAGVKFRQAAVTDLTDADPPMVRAEGTEYRASRVILTCWSDADIVEELEGGCFRKDGKTFVETDDRGKTVVDGLFAAGRITGVHHQTIVSAGDGARVALNVIEELDPDYYHDWVAPEGYFTDRGREVPPGCEEITAAERKRRDEKGRRTMIDYLRNAEAADPKPHPSQRESESEDCD